MRNMSFAMTTEQIRRREKLVTRRFGWWFLQASDLVCAVEKGMGLKKGEKIKRLAVLRIVNTRTEPLHCITKADCRLEGFPDFSPDQFVVMLCQHYGCNPNSRVNRIQFEYV
jgi:hypothetical protein